MIMALIGYDGIYLAMPPNLNLIASERERVLHNRRAGQLWCR